MDKINFNLDWSYSKIGDKNKIKCELPHDAMIYEKRNLSIELYLYSVETNQYEKVKLIDIEYSTGTGQCYYGNAYLEIGDKVYEDDYISIAFYYFDDKNRVNMVLFGKINDEFRSDFKLEEE